MYVTQIVFKKSMIQKKSFSINWSDQGIFFKEKSEQKDSINLKITTNWGSIEISFIQCKKEKNTRGHAPCIDASFTCVKKN